jgi:hypothetical protein
LGSARVGRQRAAAGEEEGAAVAAQNSFSP